MSFSAAYLILKSAQLMPSWPFLKSTSHSRHRLTLHMGQVKIVIPYSIQKMFLQLGVVQGLVSLDYANARFKEILSYLALYC